MAKPNHRTLTTTFLDAGNLKKLKNNLKSSGIQNKQLNHYLLTTYRIINDLESAQAEHRWYPKFVRPAHKEYVNTVEFVRIVAEIVSGHILNALCGASEGSSKVDDDSIAKRLLNELLKHTEATGESSSSHTHGDHIRLGVANAVAEMLAVAKKTGGLPGVVYAVKTTLSSEAEAERRRRGAAAAATLASGKYTYDYCGTGKPNPRAQASQNKQYEVPKFIMRKLNHKRTDVTAMDEKQTSSDGVKSEENSRVAIKDPVRPKLDKPGNRKEQKTVNMQNVARKVRLKKTIGSRTDQNRPTNVNRTNYPLKVDARKTVGEDIKFKISENIFVMKARDRIPRQKIIGDNDVNNTRSLKQSEVVSGANSQLQQKNIFRRKPAAVDELDKARYVQLEKPISSPTDQKQSTNVNRTNYALKADARKKVGEGIKSKNRKNIFAMKTRDRIPRLTSISDHAVNNMRSQKRSEVVRRVAMKDDRKKFDDPVLVFVNDKNRKPGTTGAPIKEVVKTSGTQRKTNQLVDVEENDDKPEKLYNTDRSIIGGNGVSEKSKTTRTRNSGSVVKKSKNPRTKDGVNKLRIDERRDETELSDTLISPTIDYHDDALLTVPRAGINEPVHKKRIFSVAETINSPRVPANVQDDNNNGSGGGGGFDGGVSGGGGSGGGGGGGVGGVGKNVMPSKTLISPAVDFHDDISITAVHDKMNESFDTKRMFTAAEIIDSPHAPEDIQDDDDSGGFGGKNAVNQDTRQDRIFDERDQTGLDNSETGRNRISERNQDEICNKTTTPTDTNKAGSRINDNCTDDDIYKLRMACVLGQLDKCKNRETGLYQAKRKGSKYEVIDLTEKEYCDLKNM